MNAHNALFGMCAALALAPDITKRWGQPAIVENRAAANGIIASEYVARSGC